MGPLEGLAYGFAVALQPTNLFACFLGVLIGTIVGILPGIGPVGAMALLLPSTFALQPATALIMLAGIYYGAMYGGSTTSILVNVPGEAASVVTALDGYQMTRKGRAGAALAVAAVGSFVAGSIGVVGIVLAASWLADQALRFGPPEYFALAVTGLLLLSRLSGGSVIHAFVMVAIGLALGTVGMDSISAHAALHLRLHPALPGRRAGAGDHGPLRRGRGDADRRVGPAQGPHRHRAPPRAPADARRSGGCPRGRSPAAPWWDSSPASSPAPPPCCRPSSRYTLERKISKTPERFGKGAIEGVAGPEAANNGATAGAMVPLLSLGIPFSPATAILLGALVITGIQPGPLLISQRPEVFWGVVASMYVGNAILLVLNLPLVGLFVSVLRLPQHVLATLVLLLCLVGAYSLNNSQLDLWVARRLRHLWLRTPQARHRPVAAGRRAGVGPPHGEDAAPGPVHGAGQCPRARGAPDHARPAPGRCIGPRRPAAGAVVAAPG